MKLAEVQILIGAIDNMRTKAFPAKVSYALYRNRERLARIAESIEKTRIDILNKYVNKNAIGEPISDEQGAASLTTENLKLFTKEFNELLRQEADVELYMIDFSLIEDLSIEGVGMEGLIYMIKPNTEVDAKVSDPQVD